MKHQDAPLCHFGDPNCNLTHSRNRLASKLHIDLGRIVFKFLQDNVGILLVGNAHHQYQFLLFDIQGVLKRTEKDTDIPVKHMRPSLKQQIDTADSHVLDFWSIIHQANERWS